MFERNIDSNYLSWGVLTLMSALVINAKEIKKVNTTSSMSNRVKIRRNLFRAGRVARLHSVLYSAADHIP